MHHLSIRLFRSQPDQRALFASYLAKLGDERALPDLNRAALFLPEAENRRKSRKKDAKKDPEDSSWKEWSGP